MKIRTVAQRPTLILAGLLLVATLSADQVAVAQTYLP